MMSPPERAVQAGAPFDSRMVTGDADDRITGRYRFAVDRYIADSAFAAVVRSSSAHGHIQEVDLSAAQQQPGVLAVIDGAQVRELLGDRMFHGESRMDQPVLAVDKVRYVGEPVALVVAETRAGAEAAARLVYPEIDELPSVVDHDHAAETDAPQLHEAWPGNDCGHYTLIHGDAEQALRNAEFVHTATYRSPTQSHAAMEPHTTTAVWLPDGQLEVWSGTQSPYVVRNRLATIFDVPPEQVRIRVDNIGGGFGGKLDIKLEAMAAVAAKLTGRPVRLELTREEVFLSAARHAATVTVSTGADRDGNLLARVIDIVYNGGAYALSTPRAIRSGMIRSVGPYRTPNLLVRVWGRYTNTVPTGPFRGAMTGQVCWAGETNLDELAGMIGIDPVQLRLRNVLRDGDTFATGEVMHGMRFAELTQAAADGIGWTQPLAQSRPGFRRGRGLALVLKSTRTPSRSDAVVEVDAAGTVTVLTSSIELGQGAHLSLAELTAAQLGCRAEQVRVSVVDTARTPFDTTTSSSRTTLTMGLAVERAAQAMRVQLDERAAALLGREPTEFVHRDGHLRYDDTELSYADIVTRSGADLLRAEGRYETPPGYGKLDPVTSQGLHTVSWHQGAVAVEVEVDVETGKVQVLAMYGASFAGRAVNVQRIRKQIEGGMIFGMGQSLMEEMIYDGGELLNGNLSDYQLPTIADVPVNIGSAVLVDDALDAPPHGVGENTVPPMAPAIGNAIFRACGGRVRELPMTGERVLRAIHAGEETR